MARTTSIGQPASSDQFKPKNFQKSRTDELISINLAPSPSVWEDTPTQPVSSNAPAGRNDKLGGATCVRCITINEAILKPDHAAGDEGALRQLALTRPPGLDRSRSSAPSARARWEKSTARATRG